MNNYYKSGTWNAICDVCGFKYKADQLRKRWDGLMVCKEDYEPRNLLDFIRAVPDNQTVPWVRPESTDVFIEHFCTVNGLTAIPGYARPGCAVPSRITPIEDTNSG